VKPVRFEPAVHEDIAGILEWYGAQNPRLPEAFLLELRSLVSLISDSPQMAPVTYRGLRRAVLRRFPYCVYYSASPDEVRVVAVLHGRRDLRPLRSRLDS
jgi:plasmid stabilization system protein ParE